MDATTMPSTISILKQLKNSYPQFIFEKGDTFCWSPNKKTIYYKPSSTQQILLLHELAHAILGHSSYDCDVQLISMERQAWERTIELAPIYNVPIDNITIQDNLNSYREWLNIRSKCPSCNAIGLQIDKSIYKCHECSHQWRVNEAKICALRRYSDINNKKRT
jgi:hypothetical protein